MARPAHGLIEFRGVFGTIAAPIEEWSWGLRCDSTFTPSELSVIAGGASSAWQTHIAPVTPTNQALAAVRVMNIKGQDADDVAGRVTRNADGSMQLYELATGFPGTGQATNAPTQLAVVVSLLSARQGPRGKGRVFLPSPSIIPSTTDFAMTQSQALSLANAFKGFVNAINGVNGFANVAVVSSYGHASPVTAVKVGRVFDTMRSRRNRREEGYATVTLA